MCAHDDLISNKKGGFTSRPCNVAVHLDHRTDQRSVVSGEVTPPIQEVGSMLDQCRRRGASIHPPLVQRLITFSPPLSPDVLTSNKSSDGFHKINRVSNIFCSGSAAGHLISFIKTPAADKRYNATLATLLIKSRFKTSCLIITRQNLCNLILHLQGEEGISYYFIMKDINFAASKYYTITR